MHFKDTVHFTAHTPKNSLPPVDWSIILSLGFSSKHFEGSMFWVQNQIGNNQILRSQGQVSHRKAKGFFHWPIWIKLLFLHTSRWQSDPTDGLVGSDDEHGMYWKFLQPTVDRCTQHTILQCILWKNEKSKGLAWCRLKHLMGKHEDWVWIFSTHIKIQAWWFILIIPASGRSKLEESRTLLASQCRQDVSTRFSERPCFNDRGRHTVCFYL